jgi:hypothetical protein
LIRNLDEAVQRGEVPGELVAEAVVKENRDRTEFLLEELRAGTKRPHLTNREMRTLVNAGLLTEDRILEAWRGGREERARTLIARLETTATPTRADVHTFQFPMERVSIESFLIDTGLSADEKARAVRLWEKHISLAALSWLYTGELIPDWRDHLERGLERGHFSGRNLRFALTVADQIHNETYFGSPEHSQLPTKLWKERHRPVID